MKRYVMKYLQSAPLLFISAIVNIESFIYYINTEKIVSRLYYRLKREGMIDKKVDLSEMKGDSIMIMLTLGQSNASNSGEELYTPHNTGKVLNYGDGNLYHASDPLIGTDGNGGNVWGQLADIIVDSGRYKKVIIIPIAVGGTAITCWTEGPCSENLKGVLSDLKKRNIDITHILYHQGETENGQMNKDKYKENLLRILKTFRDHNQYAPFFVAQTSYNKLATYNLGIDTTILNAQKEFAIENNGVCCGPNTDTIATAHDRYDGQHFSKFGMKRYAQAWYNAIFSRN